MTQEETPTRPPLPEVLHQAAPAAAAAGRTPTRCRRWA